MIDQNGRVIVGGATPYNADTVTPKIQVVTDTVFDGGFGGSSWSSDANGQITWFAKSKSGTIGTHSAVTANDVLMDIRNYGSDGTAFAQAARIVTAVDGTVASNSVPSRISFSTTAVGGTSATERMRIDSAGNVGIGGTPSAGRTLNITKNTTGSTTSINVVANGQIQSDVTTAAYVFRAVPTTQNATFTLPTLVHFDAAQGAFGASSTVSNQYGFVANGSLTGASNNFGFFGNIASGSGRWNFYAAGTAVNYFAGNVGIGSGKTAPATALDVNGTITATALDLTTALSVADGGTGQSSYVNGELLIGNTTGNTLTKATLTAGSGISITNGSGSITIASTGGSGGTSIGLVRVISTNCIFP